nr:hypothetical protein [Tanacetum cinerariifolium]
MNKSKQPRAYVSNMYFVNPMYLFQTTRLVVVLLSCAIELFEIGESSSTDAARSTGGFREDYGFVGTLDVEIRHEPDREITDQLNVLRRDRHYHANIALLVEREARVAREAWAQFMDASYREHFEVIKLQTTVLALQTENEELWAVDRRRQTQLLEALTQITGQLNVLRRDRHYHANTALLVEREARVAREAWAQFMDASYRERFEDAIKFATELVDKKIRTFAERQAENKRKSSGNANTGNNQRTIEANQWGNGCCECGAQGNFKRECPKLKNNNHGNQARNGNALVKVSYAVENQVKFATCTLHGVALTWWKSHVKTVGHDAAYGELALLCERMFLEESDKIEKYVSVLLDMIHESVMASKPKTMQDAIKFATELVDKKIRTFAERQAENKRKFEDTSRN